MVNYVLIHGGNVSTDTWNEVVGRNDYEPGGNLGGKVWDSIVPALRSDGNSVFAPTLKDEYTCDLSGHIEQVCTLINEHNLKDIVLAGHSYGGMVITGTAAKTADKIRRHVYVDAALPEPGQSLFDILTIGGLDPVTVLGGSPKAYMEKIHFDTQKIKPLPKTYIRCTESEFKSVSTIARKKIDAEGKEWSFYELPTCHIPMASMPNELAKLLLEK